MKVGYLQNIQSFETSVETGKLQSYEKQSILTAVKVTLQLEQVPSSFTTLMLKMRKKCLNKHSEYSNLAGQKFLKIALSY